MTRQTITAECPTCHVSHACDRNEDGSPDLDLSPCQDDGCTARVCASCVVKCSECGCTLCSDHAYYLHGNEGEKVCRLCLRRQMNATPTASKQDRRIGSVVCQGCNASRAVEFAYSNSAAAVIIEDHEVAGGRRCVHAGLTLKRYDVWTKYAAQLYCDADIEGLCRQRDIKEP